MWTRPLRELTPETSYGFAVIEFARDVLLEPLDPWQSWLVIHAGELLPDGRPRFRKVLILVARQNGKTHLLKVLALFWLFVEEWELVIGTSTSLDNAKEAWNKAVAMAEDNPELRKLMPTRNGVRRANGDIALKTEWGGEYKIAATNRKTARGKTTDRLIMDELREHQHWDAWKAAIPSMNARPEAQAFLLSNQGDDKSVVLNDLHTACLTFIRTGVGDERFGLFEWSAPDGCDLMDFEALAQANPNLNRRIMAEDIIGDALRARETGGENETTYRTEVLCQKVKALDAVVEPGAWNACYVPGDLQGSELRSRVAMCLDVSPDRLHATLVAAAVLPDGRIRLEVVHAWQGTVAIQQLRTQLPPWLARVNPQVTGWMPKGPAAVITADMKKNMPPRVKLEEITSEIPAVCMGFAEQVQAGQIVHNDEPLLNAHVTGAAKLWVGDVWKFRRKGEGHCDAAYAAAGAVHLARTLPAPVGKPRLVISRLAAEGRVTADEKE